MRADRKMPETTTYAEPIPSIRAIRSPPSQTVTPTAMMKPGLGPSTLRLDRSGQHVRELITRERLPEHELTPYEPTRLNRIDLDQARRVYDGEIGSRRDQSLGNPGTPAVRQVDVHQDHVDVALEPVDHFGSLFGRCRTDHVEAPRAQETPYDVANSLFVIDKEDHRLTLEFFGLLVRHVDRQLLRERSVALCTLSRNL